jgi:GDP-fucose transporter C1
VIFTAALTLVLLGTRTGLISVFAFTIIMTGMLIGSVDEYEFSAAGTFYGLACDFLMALYGALVKKSLAHVDNDQWLRPSANAC